MAPMKDVRCEVFPAGISSSSKRGKLHCYTCKIVIYSKKEYRNHLNSKAHCHEVVCQLRCRYSLTPPKGSLVP